MLYLTRFNKKEDFGASFMRREIIMSKRLVAYFSPTGTTAAVAKALAESAGADIFEIKPAIPYKPADLDWTDKHARSTIEMADDSARPAIAENIGDVSGYDVIFVGFPIWWYVAPRIINTFLESCDLSGKTVVPFATSGGSGFGKTNSKLAPSCKGAKLTAGKMFRRADKAELAAWVSSLNL